MHRYGATRLKRGDSGRRPCKGPESACAAGRLANALTLQLNAALQRAGLHSGALGFDLRSTIIDLGGLAYTNELKLLQ